MKYITLNDLNNTIRKNIQKVPRDVDFIIGIPRSGIIVASIISEFLNLPLIDVDSFVSGANPTGGDRLKLVKNRKKWNRVLVIDDTVNSGKAMREVKKKLSSFSEYEFIYGVAYLEGEGGKDEIDFFLNDVRIFTRKFTNIIYEWNIFHHYPHIMLRTMFDIDGVFCIDPPDENFKEIYEEYIQNAIPLFIPKVPIGRIVTYRLKKYAPETEKWLSDMGILYGGLTMFNANSWTERNISGISPEAFKAQIYAGDKGSILFIESDDYQAFEIHRLTGKLVLSIEGNKLYGGE